MCHRTSNMKDENIHLLRDYSSGHVLSRKYCPGGGLVIWNDMFGSTSFSCHTCKYVNPITCFFAAGGCSNQCTRRRDRLLLYVLLHTTTNVASAYTVLLLYMLADCLLALTAAVVIFYFAVLYRLISHVQAGSWYAIRWYKFSSRQ